MFFCDPPGHTGPEHLFNHGRDDIVENDYVFMHDQEPVDLNLYQLLFNDVKLRNSDIGGRWAGTDWVRDFPYPPGHIVVSERGEYVDNLCQTYEWTLHYYFYHGWACLDWFRGYDKTFLIARANTLDC